MSHDNILRRCRETARCVESNFELNCACRKDEGEALFRVIEGGQGGLPEEKCSMDAVSKVRIEGQRRLRDAKVDRYEARQKLTGLAVPPALKTYKLQVEYAIEMLSRPSPLPADYVADGYWPARERAAEILHAGPFESA